MDGEAEKNPEIPFRKRVSMEELETLLFSGWSYAQIARNFGISRERVRQICGGLGITVSLSRIQKLLKRKNLPEAWENPEALRADLERAGSVIALANQFSVKRNVIDHLLKISGVSLEKESFVEFVCAYCKEKKKIKAYIYRRAKKMGWTMHCSHVCAKKDFWRKVKEGSQKKVS